MGKFIPYTDIFRWIMVARYEYTESLELPTSNTVKNKETKRLQTDVTL